MDADLKQFYLIVPPGLEQVALFELKTWLVDNELEIKTTKGGLELSLPLEKGLLLNQVLKVPSRILLRLMDFGCRDFPKLFKKIKNFSWSPWLHPQQMVKLRVSSHQSRLKMKKRIEQTCADALEKAGFIVSDEASIEIFIRFLDDVCTVSLDTSGEHLHRRGYRQDVGEAPIRENLAAGLCYLLQFPYLMEKNVNLPRLLSSLAQIKQGAELLDPMMGSGTLLYEAALLNRRLPNREYAFQKFPCVVEFKQSGEWQSQLPKRFERFYGIELDSHTFKAAAANLRRLAHREPSVLTDDFVFSEGDFFQVEPKPQSQGIWVICNPPYDERLKSDQNLFDRLLESLEACYQPFRVGVLLPEKRSRLNWPENWRKRGELRLENGGLPVDFIVFERNK